MEAISLTGRGSRAGSRGPPAPRAPSPKRRKRRKKGARPLPGNLTTPGASLPDASIFPVIEQLAAEGRHDLPSAIASLSESLPVRAVRTEGAWSDALYPWDLLKLNAEVLKSVHEQKAGTIEKGG